MTLDERTIEPGRGDGRSPERGVAPVVIIIGVLVVLLAVGAAAYVFVVAPRAEKVPESGDVVTQGPVAELDALTVSIADMDVSTSPLPSLAVSTFDLSSLSFPGTGLFGTLSVAEVSAPQYSMTLTVPEIELDVQAAPAQEETPPAEEPAGQDEQSQGEVNAATCAQFGGIPSAAYCTAVGDPNGITLCQQCKAAGY